MSNARGWGWAAIMFGIGCFAASSCPGAGPRNILDEEIQEAQRLVGEVQNLLKRDQVDALSGGQFVEEQNRRIETMKARKALLKAIASTRTFTIYAATDASAEAHMKIADATLQDYRSFFPNLMFQPSTPVQILLYPERNEYLKYDGVHAMVLGHAISNRQKSTDLVRRGNVYKFEQNISSSKKFHRLATFEDKNPFLFVHELSHIFTYELINPRQIDINDLKPNQFLNEGISEFFASRQNPDVFKYRARFLLGGKTTEGKVVAAAPLPDLLGLFGAESYPKDASISTFYSEATLATRWLMEMPAGPQLVKFLLTAVDSRGKPMADQMESLVRNHQRTKSLPVEGFAAFAAYRRSVLDLLKDVPLQPIVAQPDSTPVVEEAGKRKKGKRERNDTGE